MSLGLKISVVVLSVLLQGAAKAGTAEPDFFDPNGYYFPEVAIIIAGYKLEWIGLHTLDYYYDGSLHDRPRFVSPSARLVLTRVVDQSRSSYNCAQPVVARNELAVACRTTAIGQVSIQGEFVDHRGQFWNRNDVLPQKTIVATATVTVVHNGKERFSRRVKFTYWQGD